MDKKDLAKLALRLYHNEKGSKEWLVYEIMTKGDLGFINKLYPELQNDVDMLKNLTEIADCMYIDLFTPEEIKEKVFCYGLPEYEQAEREKRIYPLLTEEEKELKAYADYLVNCGLDVDTHFGFLPLGFKELIDLARVKNGNSSTVDTQIEPGMDPAMPDPATPNPPNSRPNGEPLTLPVSDLPKAQKAKSRRVVSIKNDSKPKRFIAGKERSLNNNSRLWQQDDVELKVLW
jgi:hypothetical protein